MTMMTASNSRHHLETGWSLSELVATAMGLRTKGRANGVQSDPDPDADQIAELLEKVDHGYLVEESGERAYIPQFAKAGVKSFISTGGWV